MTKYISLITSCILSLITSLQVFSQNDTSMLYQRAKFLVAAEKSSANTNLTQFLDQYITVKELKASGFGKVRFLLLEFRAGKEEGIPDSLYKKNEVYYHCDYIVAAHSGLLFRLKGFLTNDFFSLLTEFSETSDVGYLLRKNIFSLKNVTEFNKRISADKIFIEDLDMECLYRYYRAQNAADMKTNKLSCLGSCTIKDRKRPYQH